MFDIYAALMLLAGSLFAGDAILLASRSESKTRPDWRTAVIAGGAGMLASELASFVAWQFASGLAGKAGGGLANWISILASGCVGSFIAAGIIFRRFGMDYWKAFIKSAIGIIPAFILYTLLLGLFTAMMAG